MEKLSPLGGVYQAGTLSGNPIATACGLKTLELISDPGFHADLHLKTGHLMQGLKAEADAAGVPFSVDWQGGLFGFFFLPELPTHYPQVIPPTWRVSTSFSTACCSRASTLPRRCTRRALSALRTARTISTARWSGAGSVQNAVSAAKAASAANRFGGFHGPAPAGWGHRSGFFICGRDIKIIAFYALFTKDIWSIVAKNAINKSACSSYLMCDAFGKHIDHHHPGNDQAQAQQRRGIQPLAQPQPAHR